MSEETPDQYEWPANQSISIGKLAGALAKAQGSMQAALYDSNNPHFKSRYASLAAVVNAIRKPLAENNLSYVQLPRVSNGCVVLTTRLLHASDEWIESSLSADVSKERNQGVQGLGSVLTYLRRYTLSAICGIAADEDDDGNHAQEAAPKAKPAPKPKPAPTVAVDKPLGHRERKANAMATIGSSMGPEGAKEMFDEFYDEFTKDGQTDYEAVCKALEAEATRLEKEGKA